ncbi:MAG TPA: TadE/TadG family type IV pilus assembly protein [Stellaceae bacterium]|nr:TadE/TadG family type IV pilus assembly protein [Stellaceae bacterium]
MIAGIFGRLSRERSGAAAVELALALPFLAAVLLPMVDIGMAAYQQMAVEDAAQAGSAYALVHGWNSTAIQTAVTNASDITGISASPAPTEFCGCPSGGTIATVTCGNTCTNGLSAGTYVSVSAQRTFTPLVPYSGYGSSAVLSAISTVRID